MNTESSRARRNVREHIFMLDCCDICYVVTDEWDICKMGGIPVLACRRCQEQPEYNLSLLLLAVN
jgi:hypothetical protein